MHRITTAARRRRLTARHRLAASRFTDDIAAIADAVVGLHASDPATVYLSCLARMTNPSVGTVDEALYRDRAVVRHHGMRRTMWVMRPARAGVMHAAVTQKIAVRERARNVKAIAASTGIDDPAGWFDAGVAEVRSFLAANGPATSRAVGQALPHLVVPVGYGTAAHTSTLNAHTKMLQQAGFDGEIVRVTSTGTWVSSEYLWAATEEWLDGPLVGRPQRESAAELVGAYLAAFGPVTETDLVWWLGDTKTVARTALRDVAAREVELDAGQSGWVLPDDIDHADRAEDAEPWVRLLPGLDPTPMGWKERGWFLDEAYADRLFDRNGNVGPTIWADGCVVGGWVQRADGSVVSELLESIADAHHDLLRAEIGRVEAALDGVVVRPRFPSRIQKSLLATR